MTNRTDTAAAAVNDVWTPSVGTPLPQPAIAAAPAKGKSFCAFEGCAQPWSRLWRKSGRPGIDGKWGCSKACLRGIVEALVRRESTSVHDGFAPQEHRHRVPLGLVLLAQGWITHPQLQQALAAQRAAGKGRIGDWLVETCGVQQDRVTRGLGVQWNRPVLAATGLQARSMALAMPAELRERSGALPLRVAGGRVLYVGFENGVDPALGLVLERMTDLQVESGLMNAGDFEHASTELAEHAAVPCTRQHVESLDRLTASVVQALQTAQPVDARLVRAGDTYWLRMWLERAALGTAHRLPATAEDVLDCLYSVSSTKSR